MYLLLGKDDSSIRCFISSPSAVCEVNEMPAAGALVLVGLIRTILAVPIAIALIFLFWKIGKLADAYAKKLKTS